MVGASARAGGLAGALLQDMAHPASLVRAAIVYLAAYAFYGLTTVAIGARARDNADAQNLARPMFAVLLAAFFATLAATGGAARQLQWLVFLPPFTPFMLLIAPQPPMIEAAALALLALAAVGAAVLALRATNLDTAGLRPSRWNARRAAAG
jgi:ABC-type Na+ efflux pump permease subunit